MKKKLLIGAALILSVGMACTSGAGDWQSYSGDKRIEERVDSVLALMTLEEKIGQMTQYSAKSDIVTGPQVNTDIEPLLKKGYIGSLFHATSSAAIRKTQETALAESRLKIPVLFAFDVIHGFKTIFPIPLAESVPGTPNWQKEVRPLPLPKLRQWVLTGLLPPWWTFHVMHVGDG